MAFRFRKSISLGKGLRINLGKTGVSLSAGRRGSGMGMTFGRRGTYLNTGLVGTGLSYRTRVDKFKHTSKTNSRNQKTHTTQNLPFDEILKALNSQSGGLVLFLLVSSLALMIYNFFLGSALLLATIAYAIWDMNTKRAKARRLVIRSRKLLFEDLGKAAQNLLKAYQIFPHQGFIPYLVELFFLYNDFETVVKIGGNNSEMAFYHQDLLAKAYIELGRDKEALEKLKILLQLADDIDKKEEILYLKARIYAQQKDFLHAISALQQIRENRFSAFYRETALLRVACMAAIGLHEEGVSLLEDILGRRRNLEEDEKEILYQLSLLQNQMGEKKKSQKTMKRLIGMDIGYKDAWELLKKWEAEE
jgi:tetratricopeptide (TPR) repeat protein